MSPSRTTGSAVIPQQRRARSISVDDIGDLTHGDDNDVNDPVVMNPFTSPTSGSRISRNFQSDDGANVATTPTTKKIRTNRRKYTKDQKSVTSTSHSNHAENESQSHTNIDPLMGSMEFDESQASFTIDENVLLPGMNTNNENGGSGSHDSSSSSSDSNDASSQSTEYSNSLEKRRAKQKKNEMTIGQKETLSLRRTRSTLFGFVITIGILGAIIISNITVEKEIQTFEHDFKSIGEGIVQSIQQHMHLQFQSFDTLANDIVTLANQEPPGSLGWPFITIPSSASILERYMALLHTSLVCIYPIVQASQRTQWEQYANAAQGWIDDDLQNTMISLDSVNATTTIEEQNSRTLFDENSSESSNNNVFQTIPESDSQSIPQYIHSTDNIPLPANATATYAVWWQYTPIISDRSFVNFNAMTSTIQAMVSSSEKPFTTMSPVQHYKPKKSKKKLSNEYATDFDDDSSNITTAVAPSRSAEDIIDMILQKQGTNESYTSGEPYTYMYYPVLNKTESGMTNKSSSAVVAVLSATIEWKAYLHHAATKGRGINCVIHQHQDRNTEVIFTFNIDADMNQIHFLGYEDLHDPNFDHLVVSYNLTLQSDTSTNEYTGLPFNDDIILYTLHIYPTEETKDSYTTMTSVIVAGGMILCFVLTLIVFCMYDAMVAKRQKIVMDNAYKTYNIVSSLFPATVRDRMIEDSAIKHQNDSSTMLGRNANLQQLLLQQDSNHSNKTKFDPSTAIADFYPSATVLFSDITGFTAWCAEREPSQVFVLLESIYSAYDTIAKKRKVFKVETIGDCYMAVVGLPEPRADHAVVMCRFARQCLSKLRGILSELEVTLGPGTADLNMRFGLHSGPVTAGVLRVSQNARFQLFGDTVNTAARMESNGSPGMIHISQETANELTASGKQGWFYPRSEKITAKGKGELQTYWLDLSASSIDDRMSLSTSSIHSSLSLQHGGNDRRLKRMIGKEEVTLADVQICRLVDWILDTLNPMLCRIVSRRVFIESQQGRSSTAGSSSRNGIQISYGPNIMDDIVSVGPPTFDEVIDPHSTLTYDDQPLDTIVSEQLHDYVHMIASRYRNDNPYHNFEHAAHVIMTIVSFMNRISSALKSWFMSQSESTDGDENLDEQVPMLNHMRNIFDDPITSFACVLAGLVHDVDHNGKPKKPASTTSSLNSSGNQQRLSTEQNSIHIAWSLLLQSEFKLLRQAIFGTSTNGNSRHHDSDLNRFRYIFVRATLATDINTAHNRSEVQYDPNNSESKSLLYKEQMKSHQSEMIDALLRPPSGIMEKAITVLEYMMQLSDVGHMIQQWPIYMKWNERLFHERLKYYNANNVGNNIKKSSKRRMSGIANASTSIASTSSEDLQHPSVYWYETELRYMKQYVLPLTEKICVEFSGIFSSNKSMCDAATPMCPQKNQKCSKEYFVAITQLLNEWTLRGPTIVDDMASKYTSQTQQRQQQSNRISSNSSVDESQSTTTMNLSSILVLPQQQERQLRDAYDNNSHTQSSYDLWMDNTTSTKESPPPRQVNTNSDSTVPSGNRDVRGNSSDHSSSRHTTHQSPNVMNGAWSETTTRPAVTPTTTTIHHPKQQLPQYPPPPLRTSQSPSSSHSPFTFL